MNKHQEFAKKLKSSLLPSHLHKRAWEYFNDYGPESADEYIRLNEVAPPPQIRDVAAPWADFTGDVVIEDGALQQMNNAMRLPVAVAGALMADAHQGYGLPIGGVLALDNAVSPYAVGVDIACRMMLTVYKIDGHPGIDTTRDFLRTILAENTLFGAGGDGMHEGNIEHPILDDPRWNSTKLLRGLHKTAVHQIGTSGGGNHFVEWGSLRFVHSTDQRDYLALLSHSGSRGVGFKIADYYSKLAMSKMSGLPAEVKHLAWLPMDSADGQEYWEAMHLAGDFASANHHVIHERLAKALGTEPFYRIENHHNFCWIEDVTLSDGSVTSAYVHRKGSTPAGYGVLGVIPGTMADPGFVVQGRGNLASLNSAPHGAGRRMSRTAAKKSITAKEHDAYLSAHGVTREGAGLDEAPQAYKDIHAVINASRELVDIKATFQPRIARMADDSNNFRDRKPAFEGVVVEEGD